MKICVGLGNPGDEYVHTRHNVGFLVIDILAERVATRLTKTKFCGSWAEISRSDQKIGLLKPQTYMNRSGSSVAACLQFYQVGSEDLLVVHDDLDLSPGQLRLAFDRGAGGHRGVESIIASLGTRKFWRLRVGIGRPVHSGDAADFVLVAMSKTEQKKFRQTVERAADAIELLYAAGAPTVMQQYHSDSNQEEVP